MYWSVATTQPRSERKAIEGLAVLGVETYAPRFRTVKIIHSRRVDALEWAMPGYVMLRWASDLWHAITSTKGITSILLTADNVPAKVSEIEIERFRSQERDGAIDLFPPQRLNHKFERGELVRITSGPFEGRAALYDGTDARGREYLLLRVFGREVRMPLSGDIVTLRAPDERPSRGKRKRAGRGRYIQRRDVAAQHDVATLA